MAKYVNLLHANNLLLMEKNYYLLVIESRLQSMFPGLKYSLRLIRKIKYPLSWNFWTSKPSIPSPLVTSLLWSHSEWKTVLGTVKMNIKNQNHCHKKRNSRQTTDHINNHSFCAFNKMQRSWDILFFCPLLFGSGLFLLTKIWMLLVLLFGYFMTCFAINLVYTSALGGVFYLVLGCGIKATWWDKLRSMCLLFYDPDLYFITLLFWYWTV